MWPARLAKVPAARGSKPIRHRRPLVADAESWCSEPEVTRLWTRLRRGLGLSADARDSDADGTDATPQPEGAERRRFPRVKLEVSARIRFPNPEAAIESNTFDISQGGVFLKTAQPRPVGTRVRLVIEIGERTLELSGVVVRVSDGHDGPAGLGVSFTELSAADEASLAELVHARRARREGLADEPS